MAFPLYSVSVAHANDYAEPDDFVNISSGLLLMFGAGAVIGPLLASATMTIIGAPGMFLFIGAMYIFLVAYVAVRAFKREPAPDDQHIAFSDALAATYTASNVCEEEIQAHAAEAT